MSLHEAGAATGKPLWLRLRQALGRVRRSFALDTYDVFLRRVRPEDREFEGPAGYRFAWAEPADVEGCDPYHTELDERERREGVQRLALGHRAVLAFHGERVVFSMWVNPRNVNVPGHVKLRLDPERVFIYKAFTSPEHRGRKLYEGGMRFVLADLARSGKQGLVGYAHLKKSISRRGLAALHFESLGRFHRLSCPGFQRTFISRELRRHLPESVPRSRAVETPAGT